MLFGGINYQYRPRFHTETRRAEILSQYRAKGREREILANFKELKQAIATGTARRGTAEDLIADLNED